MPSENHGDYQFEANYRSEDNQSPKPPGNKHYHAPDYSSQDTGDTSMDMGGDTESSLDILDQPYPSIEADSSPVVTYTKPTAVQPPQPVPTAPKHGTPNQYMYMQYKVEEDQIQFDPNLFASHPMHHCPNLCEHIKDCMLTCERTMHMLMCRPDAHVHARLIAMLQDCAEVCFLTTRQVARRSPMLKTALRYCAKVCRMCAHESMRYPSPECQACARMCLHCADVCEKFVLQNRWS